MVYDVSNSKEETIDKCLPERDEETVEGLKKKWNWK
jgi:hypothetical protein